MAKDSNEQTESGCRWELGNRGLWLEASESLVAGCARHVDTGLQSGGGVGLPLLLPGTVALPDL